jgi:ketosteroid isomerase-like protein
MNKIIACLLLCSLSGCSALLAQSADEKEIAGRVESLRKAMIAADKATLGELVAEDLSYGHSSGLIEDKAAFIDEFVKGTSVFTSISLTDQTIKIAGDVAIVRHHLIADTNNKNVPGKADILVLLIWQKQNGQWKLLARQAAKIPVQAK